MNVEQTSEVKSGAFRRLQEIDNFIAGRPAYARLVGQLMATVSACSKSGLAPPNIQLEAAHIHIYGSDDSTACEYCKYNFEIASKLAGGIYDGSPTPHSEFE